MAVAIGNDFSFFIFYNHLRWNEDGAPYVIKTRRFWPSKAL